MAQVKLILREDVDNLGNAGDLVAVKPGYARNYLLPTGRASIATEARVKELEHHRRIIEEEQAKALKDMEAVKSRLEGLSLEASAISGEGGKLFGSVTMAQVAELLAEKGFEFDRRKLSVPEPIKTLGEHEVSLKLHRDLAVALKVNVVSAGGPPPEEVDDDLAEADASLGRREPEEEAPPRRDDDDDRDARPPLEDD